MLKPRCLRFRDFLDRGLALDGSTRRTCNVVTANYEMFTTHGRSSDPRPLTTWATHGRTQMSNIVFGSSGSNMV